jgi:hypothetical protein
MDYTFEDIFIEAEVNPDHAVDFEDEYCDIAGINPALGDGYQQQVNKWGLECRIYFNASDDVVDKLKNDGYQISSARRGYKDFYSYRINNNELFWILIKKGFRLGD